MYRIIPSKHPWPLEIIFTGQKKGVGVYTEKPYIYNVYKHPNQQHHQTGGVGAYTELGTYSGDYGTYILLDIQRNFNPLAFEKIRTDSRIREIQALTPFN